MLEVLAKKKSTLLETRRVAEVFGRVFVVTGIFILGCPPEYFEIYRPGNAIFSIVHVNISNSMECKITGIFSHNNNISGVLLT